jgi:hypothetical protein
MKPLDAFRAQLPDTTRFRWIADSIALLVTQQTTYLIQDYGADGFGLYGELPNETVAESIQRITDLEDAYEKSDARNRCLSEAREERRQMGITE